MFEVLAIYLGNIVEHSTKQLTDCRRHSNRSRRSVEVESSLHPTQGLGLNFGLDFGLGLGAEGKPTGHHDVQRHTETPYIGRPRVELLFLEHFRYPVARMSLITNQPETVKLTN